MILYIRIPDVYVDCEHGVFDKCLAFWISMPRRVSQHIYIGKPKSIAWNLPSSPTRSPSLIILSHAYNYERAKRHRSASPISLVRFSSLFYFAVSSPDIRCPWWRMTRIRLVRSRALSLRASIQVPISRCNDYIPLRAWARLTLDRRRESLFVRTQNNDGPVENAMMDIYCAENPKR